MFANQLVLVEAQTLCVLRPATLSFMPLQRGVLHVHLANVIRVPFAQELQSGAPPIGDVFKRV